MAAVEDRIEADLARGRHATLVGELEALVAAQPLRERLRGQLMLALYRSGRQADALEVYRETRGTLIEQLGLEPGPALRELEQMILAHDPGLAGAEGAAERSRSLPTGTVTFLFTDIEGSTRLLSELGTDRYAGAVREHRRALREIFTRHRGVEVDTQGDSFFVAFGSASDAAAAGEALREIRPPVRVGIHTGEPAVTDEGYKRAGRLAGAVERIRESREAPLIMANPAYKRLLEATHVADDDVQAGREMTLDEAAVYALEQHGSSA